MIFNSNSLRNKSSKQGDVHFRSALNVLCLFMTCLRLLGSVSDEFVGLN